MLYISHASKARKSVLTVMLAIVLIASFLTGSVPAAHAQGAPALFSDAGTAGLLSAQTTGVARSRYVNVNMSVLLDGSGAALNATELPEVTLNLFPDVNYTGVIDEVQKTEADSTSWIGRLSNVEGGYFYLVESGGALIAHVASNQGVYEVSSAGNNLYRVIQIDESKLVDEPNEGRDIPVNNVPAPQADLGAAADSAARIDVMVVYTAAALAGEGSLAALKARIALAFTETNQSYANSGILTRLRLVHIQQVTYTETGKVVTDVARLARTADGYMDNVHALRNLYGADIVTLIVENGGGFCGQADAIRATAATAFDVVQRNACMTGYYSFGHELGHLQGARHDSYVDPLSTPYAYGHGYVNTSKLWRTVMAYNDKCLALGLDCQRLQYWSNPSKLYGGAPMGSALSKNYLVLNTTAAMVANFRTQVLSNNFNSNFNGSAFGWTRVYGNWGLVSSAYYATPGVVDVLSSIKHVGKYGDLTFTAKLKSVGPCTSCADVMFIRGNPLLLTSDKVWKSGYVFEYNNGGYFSVWKEFPTLGETPLKAWTISTAIVKGGWNTLKVVAVGALLRFFINGKLVWAGSNSAYTTGQLGIGMYRSSGTIGEKLYIDSASVSTTPTTADVNPFAVVVPGVTVLGGDMMHAP